jgi:polyhydroxyalkanoate synthase
MVTATLGAELRLGPRPLPLHLGLAAATWLGWRTGLPPSNAALPDGRARSEWANLAPRLLAGQSRAKPDALAAAIDAEARRRLDRLMTGILAYRRHPYRRDLPDPPAVWAEGTTTLLDYSAPGAGGPTVFIVPSLVNRAYILDLTAETSFVRYLAGTGVRPLLVDWGAPGPVERRFTLGDYVTRRLEPAFDHAARAGETLAVVGYCMGGLLALALAQRRASRVAGLACLATPWDFHAADAPRARALGALLPALEPLLRTLGELPVDVLQVLFAGLDPFQAIRKFMDFAAVDAASDAARLFVALEDWLNDGVGLAAPVARECLAGWYGENTPAGDRWTVAGEPVVPSKFTKPALVVAPRRDRIVPPESAAALAQRLPNVTQLDPAAGHIGMMVGNGARERLWRPLAQWIAALPAPRALARRRLDH